MATGTDIVGLLLAGVTAGVTNQLGQWFREKLNHRRIDLPNRYYHVEMLAYIMDDFAISCLKEIKFIKHAKHNNEFILSVPDIPRAIEAIDFEKIAIQDFRDYNSIRYRINISRHRFEETSSKNGADAVFDDVISTNVVIGRLALDLSKNLRKSNKTQEDEANIMLRHSLDSQMPR